jgi:hypothetical protein
MVREENEAFHGKTYQNKDRMRPNRTKSFNCVK